MVKTASILILFFALGCRITPSEEDLLQHMVVQTAFDKNTAFFAYNSFTLSRDTLGLLSTRTADTLILTQYAKQVTDRIINKMTGSGYLFLEKNQFPDLGIAAYVVEDYNVFQQVNYPTYYSGYYGYGYGGYYGYPYVSTYTSTSTTLVINLIDLKTPGQQGMLKVIWKAYIGDLLQSVDPVQKVLEAIDQAFAQSPYLHRP